MRQIVLTLLLLPGLLMAQGNPNYDPDHDLNACYTMLDVLALLVLFLPDSPGVDAANPNYDPDYDGDGIIGINDLTGFLTWFGSCDEEAFCGIPSLDGYDYDIVEIGGVCWFAENLRTTVYANGDVIAEVEDAQDWTELNTGGRCAYGNDGASAETWGLLYNGYAVDDARGLCPTGWHVPTDMDWMELESAAGMHPDELENFGSFRGVTLGVGAMLKAAEGWDSDGNGTDELGFEALPGGVRNGEDFSAGGGTFAGGGDFGYWWTSTTLTGSLTGLNRILSAFSSGINRNSNTVQSGLSVRCVKTTD